MNKIKLLATLCLFGFTGCLYAGEFNDYCTNSLSHHTFLKTNCEINEKYDGKTYCFSNEGSRDSFLFDPPTMIVKASDFYAKNAEPERAKITQEQAMAQVNSKNCDLSNKDVGYLNFDGMDLRHCNMVNTSFFGAYLRGANLSNADMRRSYLNLARLENANLSGADLRDATIFQAIFDKTNFHGANLSNARMIGTLGNVDMSEATIKHGRYGLDIGNQPMGAMRFDAVGGKFTNTNFEDSDISRANLRFADLRNANLRNTDLFRTDFSQADMTGADITGAKFGEAVLDGAIMTNVKGLEAIKGYDEAKGKCRDCEIKASASSSEAEPVSRVAAMEAAECVKQNANKKFK